MVALAVLLLAMAGSLRGVAGAARAAEAAPPAVEWVEQKVHRTSEGAMHRAGGNQLFMPLVSGGRACAAFTDDFSTSTGWFTGERDGLLAELLEGEYRLLVERPGHVWLVGAPDCPRQDNQAAVDARWSGRPGNFYGLLFSLDGRLDRAYILAVNSEARVWLVFRVHEDGLETVAGPSSHSAIRLGSQTNRLAVARTGDRVVLLINDVAVGELDDPLPGTPVIAGLAAATYTIHAPADARFDNFTHEGITN
jgi:hypothetical protein